MFVLLRKDIWTVYRIEFEFQIKNDQSQILSALFLLSVKETVQTSYLSILGIPTLFAAHTSAAGRLSQRGERVKGRLWTDSGCCYRDKSCSSRTSRSPLHSYLSHILYNKLCLWWSSPGQWCLLLWSENFKTWGERFFGTPCRSS